MRYIDADALLEKLQVYFDKQGRKSDDMALRGESELSVKYNHGQYCYLNAMEQVKDTPTADVVPKSECEKCGEKTSKVIADLQEKLSIEKAEVENLKVLLEMKDVSYAGLKELYDADTTALIEAREKTEAEVAREIFEEIDVMFRKYYNRCSEPTEFKLLEPLCQAERFIINEMWHDVAELKRKYTEGEPNG